MRFLFTYIPGDHALISPECHSARIKTPLSTKEHTLLYA